MIISNLVNQTAPPVPEKAKPDSNQWTHVYRSGGALTRAGQRVSEDTAKKLATAYRCETIISDDIGSMPLQVYRKMDRGAARVDPDGMLRNTAYLLEMQPNRWMVPFIFKKTVARWLIWWGNAYIWTPPSRYPEMFLLDASTTYPVFDEDGNKWYSTTFPNKKEKTIPDTEMAHLMLNSKDGLSGLSILEYAKETLGRQLGYHDTQDSIAGKGSLNPTAGLTVDSKGNALTPDARAQVRASYLDAVDGGVAVFDSLVTKFETITMKPTDAQFLESVMATDIDIANFFNMPSHKLNMGKQSYESNEQQELDYLKSCLNPFLIQVEQVGRLKWISEAEQPFTYLKWNRDALLQTDSKTRSEILKNRVQSAMMTPNEARQIEDLTAYEGGDGYYMPSNMALVMKDGMLSAASGQSQMGKGEQL